MGVYETLGVRTIINAAGTLTRVGGTRMSPEVLAAMNEAAAAHVHIDELQAAAGKVIAEITGAEAGYVASGAAAALTLGTAAILAGFDVGKMDRLPDTTGMKNEIVVQRGHRNAYDHAIRAAGITFVEVGYLGYPGAGGTFGWQIDAAITERTAAVVCPILETPGTLRLPEVVEIAHARGVPVIVDAAAELPPRSNLKRFIAEGADLVAFSGGKAIGGPQSSGILAGRADLIASVALQHQDMDVRSATWSRRGLIERGAVAGIPHQGFGRSLKVGREEIVGLVVALQIFAAGDDQRDADQWSLNLDPIEQALIDLPYVHMTRSSPAKLVPQLIIEINEAVAGMTAYDVSRELLDVQPGIAVGESRAEFGELNVVSRGMTMEEAEIVASRLKHILRRG